MEPIYTNEEIQRLTEDKLDFIMHLGIEGTYTVEQKEIVSKALRYTADEIDRSKDWLDK